MRSIRGIGRLFSGAPISLEELNGGAAMRQGSRFERDGCQNWDCSRICGRRAAAAIYQLLHNFIIFFYLTVIVIILVYTLNSFHYTALTIIYLQGSICVCVSEQKKYF